MSEFIRVYRKKNILLVIILVILNAGLFILSCSSEKEITKTGEELQACIDGFEEYSENIKKNSETMQQLNMYKKGFASENIRKTAKLYSETDVSDLRAGENRGVVLFIQYHLTDIFLTGFMVIISADMLSERKKGLVKAVRSTVRGRGVLYFYRVVILGVSAAVMTLLLYGGNWLAVLVKYGDPELQRCIQSVPEYMQCPYSMSTGAYIVRMLLLKAETAFAVSLIFWLLLSMCGTGAAYTVSAVFAAAEITMSSLVPAVSSVNHLRYINFCTFFKSECCYSEIFFLNFFGRAVSLPAVIQVFLLLSVTAAVTAGFILHGKCYVTEIRLFQSIADRAAKISEKLSFQRTQAGWETYKLLIKQGGIFYITAAFVLVLLSASKYNYLYQISYTEADYYEKYHGEITAEKMNEAETEEETIQKQIDFYQRRINEVMQSHSELSDSAAMQISRLTESLGTAQKKHDALEKVIENMRGGFEYFQETGNSVSLIKPYSYDLLLVRDKASVNRASLYILIGIAGAVSGVFAYDTQSNMKNTIRSAYRGRIQTTAAKLIPVLIVCTVLCTSVHMIQFVQIGKFMGYNDISSPVQSLPFMRDFGLYTSIRNYFILLFAVRSAFSCLIGLVCAFISRFSPDTSTSLGMCIFVLAVPSLLAQIVPGAGFINAVYLIGGAGF